MSALLQPLYACISTAVSAYRCKAMAATLQALSGVSVISASSDRLELRLTPEVAGDAV